MAKPATQSSRWSTVLQHRTPVISERLSKSAGFIDSSQSIQPQWDDFFFGVSPLTAFHIPGKVPGTYRHRLYGLPRIPLPGHTRKIEFPKVMSTYKFSLRLELVVCRDFIFLILLTIGCKEKIEVNNNYCPIPGASQPKEPVRLIDANSILRLINISGSAYDGIEYQAYEAGVEYVRGLIEDAPTIDPESLRPTAHIMRGTVPDTHDDAFCSNCRSYLGVPGVDYEDYDSVLSHRYKYCPYCNARIVSADE